MTDLHRATIFLSASFPSGERGDRYTPYDPSGIADAVSAFSRAILSNNGTLTFGGHPTITPLVLMISRELHVENSVTVFQSAWFKKKRLPEVDEIEKDRLGIVQWTPNGGNREKALHLMRWKMIQYKKYAGALFVGGMEGIVVEYDMVKELSPTTPRVPITGPGGAAARLSTEGYETLGLGAIKRSRAYPHMAFRFVEALAGLAAPTN